MMYAMPLYEIRYHGKGEWEQISELELMDGLYRMYKKVTPAIREMIIGKEVETPDAVYRLRLEGGEQSETSKDGSPTL